MNKEYLRSLVRDSLTESVRFVNKVLEGQYLNNIESTLKRLGRGNNFPHWYDKLKSEQVLPNLDGKTVGSVIEMLYLAVIENYTLKNVGNYRFNINPAKGVDFPDLDLGIKSPSANYCTSEPFFSAYERLLGSEFDCVVLLTNYQEAKRNPPLQLQILKYNYLYKTQLADKNLCETAKHIREFFLELNESYAKKVFRFLCYINQQDWQAKKILHLIKNIKNENAVYNIYNNLEQEFEEYNENQISKNNIPLDDEVINSFKEAQKVNPYYLGIVDLADNWVVENHKEAARLPNDNEWQRFLRSPLDGKIGMSFALQWRYNFSSLFTNSSSSMNF